MGTQPFFAQSRPRLRYGWRFGAAVVLAACALALVYGAARAVLSAGSAMALAPALSTALCAAIAAPTLRGFLRLVAGRSHGSESVALTRLAAVTQSADSPAALGEAFCQVAREALKLPQVAVYVRRDGKLVGVAGDVPETLRAGGGGVPLSDVRPRTGPGTRLLSPQEVPALAATGQRGWVVLESHKDVLGAVSIGAMPGGWGLAGRDHRLLQALCRDLAQSLRAVEIFGEFASVESLARDLEIGREVQSGFLSRSIPPVKGVQVAARSRPARENGGDFFDALEVEGGRVGLLIGDAAGRGIAAALHMAMTLSFFRSLVPGASSPRQVLEQINELICRYRASSKTFVSACYGIYDSRDKTLTIANAGMPPPVLNGRPLDLKGLPLGARQNVRFREEKFPLTSGDVLVLMSDGINSLRQGRKLGWERIFRMVGDHAALSAEGLIDQMLRSCTDWSGGTVADDATLICLKVGEGGTRLVKGQAARHTRKLSGPVGPGQPL